MNALPFLPYVRVLLKSLIPMPWDFKPTTFGEHLKKRRLMLRLYQKDVAEILGVCLATIVHWEKGVAEPVNNEMPGIISFLGYNPLPEPEERTLASLIRARRRELGLSHRAAAKVLDVHPDTVLYWENEGRCPQPKFMPRIISFLGCNPFLRHNATIPELLRARRQALGVTQKEAAKLLGTGQAIFCRWEQGLPVRRKQFRLAIAEFLGLPVEEVRAVVGE